jgi:hypothetical protein
MNTTIQTLNAALLALLLSNAALADNASAEPPSSGQASVRPEASGPKTRAQVRAETLEAARIAPLSRGEHYHFYTPEELRRIQQAGLRALAVEMAAR